MTETVDGATLGLLKIGVRRAQERLREFEKRYDLSSDEFRRRLEAGEIDEKPAFIEWADEIRVFHFLKAYHRAVEVAE